MAWGWLAKLGAVGAAPFTGGASLAALPVIDGVGAALGAGSQASATNRGQQFSGQMELARLLQDRDYRMGTLNAQADNDFFDQTVRREEENRAGRGDAWKKLLSAQRVTNPGARPQLSPYSVAPRQATHAETTAATALSEETRNRLLNGNPMPEVTRRTVTMGDPLATVDPNLLRAGRGEQVSGWLAALLSGYANSGRDREDARPAPGYTSPRVTGGMRF